LVSPGSAILVERFPGNSPKLTMYRWWENNVSKNFMPVAEAVLEMLDTLLLEDLTGFQRQLWKRRIEARVYYGLAVSLREIHDERYWEFAIESFLKWPFCGAIIPPYRYIVFAHMLCRARLYKVSSLLREKRIIGISRIRLNTRQMPSGKNAPSRNRSCREFTETELTSRVVEISASNLRLYLAFPPLLSSPPDAEGGERPQLPRLDCLTAHPDAICRLS
jgi:hypothetical protein